MDRCDMRIKSIELRNIRSYVDNRVEFPEGSTLLAGDIGCGKSTLLQAIEFALFGLKPGELTGTDLLRHGANSGLVRLNVELDGKDVVIERALKRGKERIAQDNGFLEVNGSGNSSMTALELKSRMLDMLGYSQDMLKKNKPLFRYTVYTPQEHMKNIMFDQEQRLTTLRSLFGVDKYGTIRNNARTVLTELRAARRELDAVSRDIDKDLAKVDELKESKKAISHAVFDHKLRLEEIERRLKKEKDDLENLRKDFNALQEKKQDLVRKETELRTKESRLGRLSSELMQAEEKIRKMGADVEKMEFEDTSVLRRSLATMEDQRDALVSERAVLDREIKNLVPVHEKGVCSVCGQQVRSREEFRQHIDKKSSRLKEAEKELAVLTSSIADTKERIGEMDRLRNTRIVYDELLKRKTEIEREKTQLASDVETLMIDIDNMKPQFERFDGMNADIRNQERVVSGIISEKMGTEKEISKMEQQLENFDSHIEEVRKTIERKEDAKKRAARVSDIINWFDPFLALTETMEKHVMVAIQKDFDQYFQKWFSVIMSDQLGVKIDEQFTPKIEQNGYETDYENLSGGEKTSVALAYRLALNKVINHMVDNIKTKDLLILDEPTDGFSTDQLDRIRDVINELKLRQIIVVSHEQKIDTYVDNVIRVFKENHVSRVAY